MSLPKEIARRRTFAIISHPDAGKTTLTEKFLLYGGALNLAGGVRDRKNQRATASDWMELEKQRGISVSSTVLQFEYRGYAVNLLDTPGHQDFSEDTYRVLTAVDAAVMVLDAAKGIEPQTLKLFQVCRQRNVPIFTFVNKCDRPGREPLSILDEIHETLGLQPFAVTWPVGEGMDFRGVFDRLESRVHWFEKSAGGRHRASVEVGGIDDPAFAGRLPAPLLDKVRDELELLEGAGTDFDRGTVLAGEQTPVYFGSAINNFGIERLLNGFLDLAPPPAPRAADDREVPPEAPFFSAFIFKIQANLDARHRDRLAFLRVCSGKFTRDMQVYHAQTGKRIRLSFSHQLFGNERDTRDEAWPGDILGITGQSGFGIGDTLTEDPKVRYDAIPTFAPECFAYFHNPDTGNYKRFRAGLDQLLQERVVQRFHPLDSVSQVPLLGAVGALQFDVVAYRLENEYNAPARVERAPWTVTRWLDPAFDESHLADLYLGGATLVRDDEGDLVLLFPGECEFNYFERKNPDLKLHATRRRDRFNTTAADAVRAAASV